jgi:hypothetical protein
VKNNKYYNSVYAVICTAVVLKEISSKKCTLYLKDLKKKNLVSDKLNTLSPMEGEEPYIFWGH